MFWFLAEKFWLFERFMLLREVERSFNTSIRRIFLLLIFKLVRAGIDGRIEYFLFFTKLGVFLQRLGVKQISFFLVSLRSLHIFINTSFLHFSSSGFCRVYFFL